MRWLLPLLLIPLLAGCVSEEASTDQASDSVAPSSTIDAVEEAVPPGIDPVTITVDEVGDYGYVLAAPQPVNGVKSDPTPAPRYNIVAGTERLDIHLTFEWEVIDPEATATLSVRCMDDAGRSCPGTDVLAEVSGTSPLTVDQTDLEVPEGFQVVLEPSLTTVMPWEGSPPVHLQRTDDYSITGELILS